MLNSLGIILHFGPFLYFVCFAVSQSASCDTSTYGKPKESDCTTLFKKFTESQILQSRLFDEEQLRAEPEPDFSWPGIDNPFTIPVVQLPKFYSMSQPKLSPLFLKRPGLLTIMHERYRYMQFRHHALYQSPQPLYFSSRDQQLG